MTQSVLDKCSITYNSLQEFLAERGLLLADNGGFIENALRSTRYEANFDPERAIETIASIEASLKNVGVYPVDYSSVSAFSRRSLMAMDIKDEKVYLLLTYDSSSATVVIFAKTHEIVNQAAVLIAPLFNLKEKDNGTISVSTVFKGTHGARVGTASVVAPKIEDIQCNYQKSIFNSINSSFLADPIPPGRIAILSGPPGTGKTYILRYLIGSMVKNIKPVLIIDPDWFLTDRNAYYEVVDDVEDTRPIMFIMEDAASAILTEARQQAHSPLTSLLNLADGLLSRSRHDLYVVTFNEDVNQIDPAITRPGRCMANIKFAPLNKKEMEVWAKQNNLDKSLLRPYHELTLAQLYALKAELPISHIDDEPSIGF